MVLLLLLLLWYFLQQDDELFELLSRATVNIMHELSPHSLSDLTWAFAAAKPPSAAAVLTAAAPAAAACLERFSMGMLADLMWAYAHVKVFDENLMQAAAQVSTNGVSRIGSPNFAQALSLAMRANAHIAAQNLQ